LFDFNQSQNALTNFNKNPKYEIRENLLEASWYMQMDRHDKANSYFLFVNIP